jgi:hypothetical protein
MTRLKQIRLTDTTLLMIGLVLLVIFTIFSVLTSRGPSGSEASVRSADADGALALRLWLEEVGYDVRELVNSRQSPNELDVIFVLKPSSEYSTVDAARLHEWVSQGHTLIVAGDSPTIRSVLQPYDVFARLEDFHFDDVRQTSPTLVNPPVEGLPVDVVYGFESSRRDMVMHMAVNGTPILVSFPEGEGVVWASGTVRPFTNRGLRDPASAHLILNLLAHVPRGSTIGFDEALHDFTTTPESLSDWLVTSAPGWSFLSALALTMVFLVTRGRRQGVAVPLPDERLRREPVEYIQSMANLLRRSGQRADTLRHYRRVLRRELSRRYAIDPRLTDKELLERVVSRDPTLDAGKLADLLRRLSRDDISEHELVEISMQVNEWIRGNH